MDSTSAIKAFTRLAWPESPKHESAMEAVLLIPGQGEVSVGRVAFTETPGSKAPSF
jgi:hypothetical protein